MEKKVDLFIGEVQNLPASKAKALQVALKKLGVDSKLVKEEPPCPPCLLVKEYRKVNSALEKIWGFVDENSSTWEEGTSIGELKRDLKSMYSHINTLQAKILSLDYAIENFETALTKLEKEKAIENFEGKSKKE
jgi:hypothetical protein